MKVVVIRVLGVKEKKEVEKMKLILSTIHLTQVAFLEEKFTGEDDLSHHVQADERQTGNSSK